MTLNVLDYLDRSARICPENIAFVDIENSINYADLQLRAKRIGCHIISDQNQIRKPIVVFVDRNIDCLVAFLGVAYSGNFYVPIDSSMPINRIKLIMDTLKPVAILNTPSCEGFAAKIDPTIKEYDFEELVSVDRVDELELNKVRKQIIDLDPIYATFTSGSTGIPKGVITCHRSVIDMTDNLVETFGFDETSIFGNQNPFYFDASIKDIYTALSCGATMHVLPKAFFLQMGDLVDYLIENKVNTMLWSASAIGLLAAARAFEEQSPIHLRYVMFSGEVMHNKVLNYWRNHLPSTKFVNLYGPTEITSVCTYYEINRAYDDHEVLPIGIPFRNCEVLILDEEGELVNGGEVGELCVRGCCLAMGYYNANKKTSASFVQNPQNAHYPEVIYKTGDLAYWNKDGQVMFMSRKDNQVKHMGQRVELGEIEILLNAMELIEASICFYDHDKQKIIAIYKGNKADKKYVFGHLRDSVSKFMFPNILVKMAELPHNLNGKIDRSLLKDQYFAGELNQL